MSLVSIDTVGVHILINFIVSHYFTDCFTTCHLVERGNGENFYSPEVPIMVLSSAPGEEPDPSYYNRIAQGIDIGCKCWILDTSVIDPFLDQYYNITSTVSEQRPIRPKFLIYGFTRNTTSEPAELPSILNHILMKTVPDALFLFPSTDNAFDFDLLTPKFVGRLYNPNLDLIESVRINSMVVTGGAEDAVEISFKSAHQRQLFSRAKVLELHDRHVPLAVFYYNPYIASIQVPEGTGNANSWDLYMKSTEQLENSSVATFPEKTVHVDGTEGWMLLEFCKKLNCTLLVIEDDGFEWGTVYDNYTGNGGLGRVAERTAEIAVGSMYIWYNMYGFMQFSVAMSTSGITGLVPKPKLIDASLIPLMPFTGHVWLALSISCLVICLTNYLVDKTNEKLGSDRATFFDSNFFVLQILVEQSVVHRSLLMTKGFLMTLILLQAFVVGSGFAGALLSFLAVPRREPPIDTDVDFAKTDMNWTAPHIAWIYGILETDNPVTMAVRDQFEVNSGEEMREMGLKASKVIAMEHLDYGYYAFGNFVSLRTLEKMRPMRGNLIYGPIAAPIMRSWFLKDEFDEFVMRVGQSGIQSYWLLDTTYRLMDSSVQVALKLSNHHSDEREGADPLQIDRMIGIFYMWIFGMLLSIVAFIGELLRFRYTRHM